MATLQVLSSSGWETFSGQPAVGNVVFYRWQGETASVATTDDFPTAGARYVTAYLGSVALEDPGASVDTGSLYIISDTHTQAAGSLDGASVPTEDGGNCVLGRVDSAVSGSNTAAILVNPPARCRLGLTSMTGTNTPVFDLVIEVHY